ncbi:MAG: NAD-dependent epimerase/dehydratase family protein [Lachnospiraceae bacterium]|nr:NAD-dependent epimerase/dehydratase family protein [Lachnospiraceae bacterium]
MNVTPIIEKDILAMLDATQVIEDLRGSSFLITGATGFIGSYVIHSLMMDAQAHDADTKVYALVRSANRARAMFGDYEAQGRVIFVEQDVCTTLTLTDDVDYIVHCASNAGPKEYSENPVGTMNINFLGTANLLEYAIKHVRKRFLYVSTIEIYGTTYNNPSIRESDYGLIDACNPRSCYPLSKKACETMTISYGKQYQIPVSIGRLSYIYGPGMKSDDSKVAAMFPRQVAAGKDIVMKSRGEQNRSYTYVTDAIAGLFTVLANGENQQAYNIASRIGITTICGMAQRLVELFPEQNAKVVFDLPTESEKQAFSLIADAVLNSEKLEALGWQPITDLDNGLTHTVLDEMDRIKGADR